LLEEERGVTGRAYRECEAQMTGRYRDSESEAG
jgi:hypothetical protein